MNIYCNRALLRPSGAGDGFVNSIPLFLVEATSSDELSFDGVPLTVDDLATDVLEDFLALVTIGRDFLATHALQNQSPSGIFLSPRSSKKCSASHLYGNLYGRINYSQKSRRFRLGNRSRIL